jgi:hypothetical protein
MCHSWFLGLLVGVLAFKALRYCAWRHGFGGRHCGGFRPHHGPCRGGRRGFVCFRSGGYGEADFGGPAGSQGTRPINQVLKSLELNQRQQEEALPVLTLLQEVAGSSGPRIEAVLLAVAAARFEPQLVEGVLADVPPGPRRELVDGLEHLHNILIPEQRETLREQLVRKPKTGPTPPPSSES